MVKKKFLPALLLMFVLISNKSYAEGQKGISDIINFTNSVFIFVQILVYTFFSGIIFRFLLRKFKPEIRNRNIIAFTISFLLILLIMVVKEKQ